MIQANHRISDTAASVEEEPKTKIDKEFPAAYTELVYGERLLHLQPGHKLTQKPNIQSTFGLLYRDTSSREKKGITSCRA